MPAIDAPHAAPPPPSPATEESRRRNGAARHVLEEFSRARKAGAMADAGHRLPERIRALYLKRIGGSQEVPAAFSDPIAPDEHAAQFQRVAFAFKLTAIAVVLGVIATLALTA